MADIMTDELNRLMKEFKQMAKRADQRLVRMEQAGKTGVGSYKGAMKRIQAFTPGGTRFNVNVPKDIRGLRSRISAVKEFLATETSTATGRKAVSKRTRDTIRDRYGLDIKNDDQLTAVFEGGLWSKLNKMFGSDTAVKILASVQNEDGDIKDAIQANADKYFISDTEADNAADLIGQWISDKNIGKIFGR